MFGVEFHKAQNSLIVVEAEFVVGTGSEQRLYKYIGGMHNARLQVMDPEGGWETVATTDVEEAVVKALPTTYGMVWTWHDFLIALTFWGEGNKKGYYKGLYKREKKNDHHCSKTQPSRIP